MPAGYSGKPLCEKLGLKAGQRVIVVDSPEDYHRLIEGKVRDLTITDNMRAAADMAHVFVTSAAALRQKLPILIKAIAPDGAIWVSWPKKAARVPTELTEDIIRQIAVPLGLVDVKVCAINDTWSGLKLVIRRERR